MTDNILSSGGVLVEVNEAESCNITATFNDITGTAIAKANLATLTCTLTNEADGSVINSRSAQSVLDANGGTVASDGTLTLRMQPADNVIVGTIPAGGSETHKLTLAWTWSDGVLTRTGKEEGLITVVSNG